MLKNVHLKQMVAFTKTRTQRLHSRHAKKARDAAIDAALALLFQSVAQSEAAECLRAASETALSDAMLLPVS